jgi:hypothetical protein
MADQTKILTRADVIAQIEARIAGTINQQQLAKWAFDRFYAYELDEEAFEEGAEDDINDVLDELMFDDDPNFELDVEELRDLISQLAEL